MIARPQQSSSRVFPKITSDLYTHLSPSEKDEVLEGNTSEQSVATFLLSLSHRDLTKAQLFFGRDLSPQEQLARFLIQHRLGFEAELAAQWQRADFYWQQVQLQLKSLIKQESLWKALVSDIAQQYPEADSLKEPIYLQKRLVEELLIDTHCGFFNGLNQWSTDSDSDNDSDSKQAASCDRSFDHAAFIEKLLPYSSIEQEAWLSLLALPWQQQVTWARTNKNWQSALRLCRHRLTLYPESTTYQNELAEVQSESTLVQLKKSESSAQYLANAQKLAKGIRQFESMAKVYPYNPVIYDYLGNFHHLHAVQLGNGQQVAEGLVAVEKALAYVPYLQEASTTRTFLIQTMNQIQSNVQQMLAALKRKPNTRLNAQGQKLNAQAKKGFTLRDNYLASDHPSLVQAAIKLARAMQVWHQLPGLPADPTEQQARSLHAGLAHIFQQPPPDKASLPDDWQRVCQAQPELAELPAEPICEFLEQRLWKKQIPSPTITPPPSPPDAVVIQPRYQYPQPSQEPFLPWLFSRQNPLLKAQMGAAVVALLIAGSLGLYELSTRSTRARAYAQLLEANQQDKFINVMESAETFLSRTPLSGKDARESQVKDLYSQAFVNWFMQQPTSPQDSKVHRHVNRYQKLMEP